MTLRILQLLLLLEEPEVLLALLIRESLSRVLPHHLVLAKIRRHLSISLSSLLRLALLGCVLVSRLHERAPILPRELVRLQLLNYVLHVLTRVLQLRELLLKTDVERLKRD